MEPRLSTLTDPFEADARAQDLVRYAIAKYSSYDLTSCREHFYARRQRTKSAVDPTVFPDLDFAVASAAFLGLVDRQSVVGQLAGPIRVAPATEIGRMLTRPAGGWRGEGAPKAVGTFTFDGTPLDPLTVAAIAAASAEFVRRPDLDATTTITTALVSALATLTDTALLDPANAGTVGVKPASILNGLSAATSNASPAIAAGAALNAISDGAPTRPALVLSFTNALKSSALVSDLREIGVQVIISPAAGAHVIAIDAARLVIASGDATVAQSRGATLELDSAPIGSTPGVSLFQQNLIGFKAQRIINWQAGSGAAAYSTVTA